MGRAEQRLRERAKRIQEPPVNRQQHRPARRMYATGAASIEYVVIRIVSAATLHPKFFRIWAQVLEYDPLTEIEGEGDNAVTTTYPAVEGRTRVTGDFIRVYPPPGVQYDMFTPFVRPLLHAGTGLPIEDTTVGDTQTPIVFPLPDDGTEDSDAMRAAFDAAVADEVVASNVYPIVKINSQGIATIFPPVWVDPNTAFYDETQEMSEGSGV